MKITSVHIRNFRKLKNCRIDFGEKETVFVGANNSGKTSAISAIVWFLRNNEKFGSVLKPSCKPILLSAQFHKYLLPLHHEE